MRSSPGRSAWCGAVLLAGGAACGAPVEDTLSAPPPVSVTLRYKDIELRASEVTVRGAMTNWEPRPLNKINFFLWEIPMDVVPGAYPYHLLVDGRETLDPDAKESRLVEGRGWCSFLLAGGVTLQATPLPSAGPSLSPPEPVKPGSGSEPAAPTAPQPPPQTPPLTPSAQIPPEAPPQAPPETLYTVVFKFFNKRAEKVSLVGDFNSWKAGEYPFEKQKDGKSWMLSLNFPKGKYLYQFWVDGKLVNDANNSRREKGRSVLELPKPPAKPR